MATLKGTSKRMRGKVGNTVTYQLKTQTVTRSIGRTTKKPTKKQLPARQKFRMITALLKPVKDFIRVGFAEEAQGTKWSAYNIATSENNLNAIIGEGTNLEINWPAVVFSRGKMPVTENITVQLVDDQLEFSWNPQTLLRGMKDSDRIMVMAYCPAKKSASFIFDGNRRFEGTERLTVNTYSKKVVVHTYAAFISADRKKISNTVYTGQFLC
jgi:hypothetical protein